ncbi:hypothetical protein HK101_000469, partial [Irineochytrium annulatum]
RTNNRRGRGGRNPGPGSGYRKNRASNNNNSPAANDAGEGKKAHSDILAFVDVEVLRNFRREDVDVIFSTPFYPAESVPLETRESYAERIRDELLFLCPDILLFIGFNTESLEQINLFLRNAIIEWRGRFAFYARGLRQRHAALVAKEPRPLGIPVIPSNLFQLPVTVLRDLNDALNRCEARYTAQLIADKADKDRQRERENQVKAAAQYIATYEPGTEKYLRAQAIIACAREGANLAIPSIPIYHRPADPHATVIVGRIEPSYALLPPRHPLAPEARHHPYVHGAHRRQGPPSAVTLANAARNPGSDLGDTVAKLRVRSEQGDRQSYQRLWTLPPPRGPFATTPPTHGHLGVPPPPPLPPKISDPSRRASSQAGSARSARSIRDLVDREDAPVATSSGAES